MTLYIYVEGGQIQTICADSDAPLTVYVEDFDKHSEEETLFCDWSDQIESKTAEEMRLLVKAGKKADPRWDEEPANA